MDHLGAVVEQPPDAVPADIANDAVALSFGMALVPAGRLGDARSRRRVLVGGIVLFTAASALCGAATGPWWLAAARIAQGVGGGLITPQVSGFIQNLFRGEERGRAFGLFGATVGISTALGPLLGGLLIQLGGESSGWRWVFYVNVPIGVALIVLARRWLPQAPGRRTASLDPVGVLLFAGTTLLVLLPVVGGAQGQPLSEGPWWLVGVAVVTGAVFLAWEVLWSRQGNETLVDLSLRQVPSYVFGVSLGTFYFAGFTAIFLILTLYLQEGLGYSALQAGAKHGMHTMDQHLADLVKTHKITYETGLEKCHHVEDFNRLCGRA